MEYTIDLPNMVNITKKKKFSLNLNQYRNAHYFSLSKAKNEFEKIVSPLLKNLPKFTECSLTYTFYPKNKVFASDLGNVCPIVGKFFEDTLVNAGKLPDDSPEYIKEINYKFGGFDNNNPRTTVTIKGKGLMKITLTQQEIEQALVKHINTMFLANVSSDISILFKSEKGGNVSADIILNKTMSTNSGSNNVNQYNSFISNTQNNGLTPRSGTKKRGISKPKEPENIEQVEEQPVETVKTPFQDKEPEMNMESTSLFENKAEDTGMDEAEPETKPTTSNSLFSSLVKP